MKFIDLGPQRYSRRVLEAVHIRLHCNNISSDGGIEIPEVWIPTIRQYNSLPQRTAEGTVSSPDNTNNALDRISPTISEVRDTPVTNYHLRWYK